MPDGAAPSDVGLLAALLAAVQRIEATQAEILRALRRPADARVAELLVAAFNVAGDAPVSAAYLYELALDDVPGRADLRAALLSAVGREPDGAVRRLGRWLAEHDGIESEGLRLVRLPGRGRDGTLYRIVDTVP